VNGLKPFPLFVVMDRNATLEVKYLNFKTEPIDGVGTKEEISSLSE